MIFFWYILAPFRALYKIYFGIVFFTIALLLFPIFWVLLKDEKNIRRAYKVKKFWSRVICILCFIKVQRIGKHHLPQSPYVVCANHASYLDIVVMFLIIPDTTLFLGKAELQKWPIVKVFFKNMDIPVDRSNKRKAAQSIELTKQAIEKGYCIAIFPEGIIPDDNVPLMQRFKNGAFALAIAKQVPIVPLTFATNWKLFSHHGDLFGYGMPGISKTIIHPPIKTIGMTEKDLVSLREKTKEVIEAPLKKYYKQEWK